MPQRRRAETSLAASRARLETFAIRGRQHEVRQESPYPYSIAARKVTFFAQRSVIDARQLVLARRDDRCDPSPATPASDARIAIALVTRHVPRPAAAATEESMGHRRLECLALVHLAGCDVDRHDEATAVADQVDLRPEPAARTPQGMVRGLLHLRPVASTQLTRVVRPFLPAPAAALLALTIVPSTHQRSWSSRPLSSNSSSSEVTMRTQVLSRRQALKRQNTVSHGP